MARLRSDWIHRRVRPGRMRQCRRGISGTDWASCGSRCGDPSGVVLGEALHGGSAGRPAPRAGDAGRLPAGVDDGVRGGRRGRPAGVSGDRAAGVVVHAGGCGAGRGGTGGGCGGGYAAGLAGLVVALAMTCDVPLECRLDNVAEGFAPLFGYGLCGVPDVPLDTDGVDGFGPVGTGRAPTSSSRRFGHAQKCSTENLARAGDMQPSTSISCSTLNP